MASDTSSVPVNGNASQQGYDATASAQNPTTSDIPKDEVGWYFVEQYYTTLSRTPDKLYLFYNKRSQFVLGEETDKVAVCVGQKAINERIKDLDFNDCKVRVTNVDSQASDNNILIQVIGEISNKSQPHKKFVQTFVLAAQTNGYFVLNDIFRYLVDEEEEEAVEAVEEPVAAEEPAPAQTGAQESATSATLTTSEDPAEIEQSAQAVDREIEAKLASEPATPAVPTTNGTTETEEDEEAAPEIAPATATQEEKPKEPVVTPAVSPPKKAASVQSTNGAAAPAPAPAKPAAPKTWAGLLANSARVATPVATPAPAQAQTQSQPKAAPSAPAAAAPAQAPAAPAADESTPRVASPTSSQQDEWTSVGDKKQSRTQATTTQEGPQNRAYIKNVHENVDTKALKALLEKFGEVTYFDVSRQKNCAFVDFKTAEGYKAAVDANPHQLGNDRMFVEERRMKPGAYPYVPRGGMRGGRGGPVGGQPRGNFQGGSRGGFSQRGRGGGQQQQQQAAAGAKPRGGAQAA